MNDDPRDAAAAPDAEHPEVVTRNARVGLAFFAVYCVLYAGFMGISAFSFSSLGATPFGGVNLAVIYGLLLIVGAFVLAVLYMFAVRRRGEGGR